MLQAIFGKSPRPAYDAFFWALYWYTGDPFGHYVSLGQDVLTTYWLVSVLMHHGRFKICEKLSGSQGLK